MKKTNSIPKLEDVTIIEVKDVRIDPKQKEKFEQAGQFVYDIRHTDSDWTEPATIEHYVYVNHFGYIVTDRPIVAVPASPEDRPYTDLNKKQRQLIVNRLFN